MRSRLGIFGGMFDPVHNGHVCAARFAMETLDLDAIKIIPCNLPNHKKALSASAADRLAMLELALTGEPSMAIDDCEIRRGGISYTAETVRKFAEAGSWKHRIFVMGMDTFNALPSWHDWQGFLDSCHVMVLRRSSQEVDETASEELDLDRRQVAEPHELFERFAGKIYFAPQFNMELSSTQVRGLLLDDGDVSGFLDRKVAEYIREHSLYDHNSTF